MPIPLPGLDDRTWADLVAELRAALPRTAPGWTDHNLSDPGITLLELFAWATELLIFRAGRLPGAGRRAFLRQFGIVPRPPAAATTVVAIRLPAAGLRLPAGALITNDSGTTRFTTTRAADLSPAWLELGPEPTDRGRLVAHGGDRSADVTAANRLPGGSFEPFGTAPTDGDSLELAFDVPPVPDGQRVRLWVWTSRWPDPGPRRAHPGIHTAWDYWAGAVGWRPVRDVHDRTRGLTTSGPVLLAGLPGHRAGPGDSRYRLRCRLVAGAAEYRPRLRRIAINAVPVVHAEAANGGPLAVSRGEALETYALSRAPVLAGSLRLSVAGTGRWREVPDWDHSGPYDRHVRLDPERGVLEFGDGRRGLVPPAGAAITVLRYRVGGGTAGNVPAGTLRRLPGVEIVQPEDATGGAAAEDLVDAQARLLDRLGTAHRGVTGADLAELALGTPGLAVCRARAVPGRHPGYPGLTVPGAVTLVVLTANGTASDAVVRAVGDFLDPRRPLGCELHVTAPGWRPVAVRATLHVATVDPGLAARAAEAIDAFLDPVTGGPARTGWPWGRAVYRNEIAAVLADLPGVDRISGLLLNDGGTDVVLCATDLVRARPHTFHIEED